MFHLDSSLDINRNYTISSGETSEKQNTYAEASPLSLGDRTEILRRSDLCFFPPVCSCSSPALSAWSRQWLYFGSERIITVIRLLVIQVRTHNWLERHKCTLCFQKPAVLLWKLHCFCSKWTDNWRNGKVVISWEAVQACFWGVKHSERLDTIHSVG